MGLLDDLLGQVTGDTRAPLERDRPAAGTAAASGGMGPILTALLPVVLSMLAGGRTGSAPARAGASSAGGLGDVLGQVLGGATGGAGGSGGGLGALLEQLQRAGYGEQAGSWVGRGTNQPLPAQALDHALGRDQIAEIARRAGVSEQDASRGLAEVLPEVVDRMTPDGQVPAQDQLLASVDALTRKLGLG